MHSFSPSLSPLPLQFCDQHLITWLSWGSSSPSWYSCNIWPGVWSIWVWLIAILHMGTWLPRPWTSLHGDRRLEMSSSSSGDFLFQNHPHESIIFTTNVQMRWLTPEQLPNSFSSGWFYSVHLERKHLRWNPPHLFNSTNSCFYSIFLRVKYSLLKMVDV